MLENDVSNGTGLFVNDVCDVSAIENSGSAPKMKIHSTRGTPYVQTAVVDSRHDRVEFDNKPIHKFNKTQIEEGQKASTDDHGQDGHGSMFDCFQSILADESPVCIVSFEELVSVSEADLNHRAQEPQFVCSELYELCLDSDLTESKSICDDLYETCITCDQLIKLAT